MSDSSTPRFDTLAIHAGQTPDPTTGSRAVPIYQTVAYNFRDTEHAANLFGLREFGNIYSRIMNPTNDVLEQRIAALHGGTTALAVASGHAAENLALLNLAGCGDSIVCSTSLYGGTWNIFLHTFKRLGITVRFVEPTDVDGFVRETDDTTKAWFVETIGNPRLDVPNLRALADAGRGLGVPLVVDNTFATPYLCRPFEHGAAVVIESLTKWLGGHGTSIGGVIVDGGNFDWGNGRFPQFTEGDPELPRAEVLGRRSATSRAWATSRSAYVRACSCSATSGRRCRPSIRSSSSWVSRRSGFASSGTATTHSRSRAGSRRTRRSRG